MKTKSKSLSFLTVGALACALAGSLSANDRQDEFEAMDANTDGKVTQAEHLAFSQTLFQQSDTNRDANVTAAEWDASATAARPGEKMDAAATAAQLRQMDTDGNGKISASESDSFATALFTKSDKDGDGLLTKAEHKAANKAHEKQKKQLSGH